MIPHARVQVEEDEVAEVARVLRSGRLAQGPEVAAFERETAAFMGVREGVAVSSGTAALHLALLALGVGPGDEVVIPSYVCTALVHAVRHAGAVPVLVDVDPETGNMDPEAAKEAKGPGTRAVIAPHLFGRPAEVERVVELGVPVIEDCAQSIGARIGERMAGAVGALAVCSFYATKMLGVGEGGMVLSNDPAMAAEVRDRRDYDEKETFAVRYNVKLTEMQAALGRRRLGKLPRWIDRRRGLAEAYREGLAGADVGLPPEDEDGVWYRFVVDVPEAAGFIARMEENGVVCRRPVFRPLHHFLGLPGFEVTERLWSRSVSLPLYPSLQDTEVHQVVDAIWRSLEKRG